MIRPHPSHPQFYSTFNEISAPFPGILLDAYGVFWGGNGVGLLPGCKEIMEKLVASGKIVGILSNSTQLAQKEIDKLSTHGLIEGKHFHFLITSGEVTRAIFANQQLPFPTPNKKFYLFGEAHPKFSSHQPLFALSPYQETEDISKADFIYLSIPHIGGEDQLDPQVFFDKVLAFSDSKLPMVCANPDRFAHEGSPARLVVRQGTIAAMYEKLGGEVFYIGKPSDKMFYAAMEAFFHYRLADQKEILMVGDTPETDIRGASAFGMSSALITTTGVLAERISQHGLEETLKAFTAHDFPTYFIKALRTHEEG